MSPIPAVGRRGRLLAPVVVDYEDDFNRANAVGLGTSSGGAIWVATSGNFQIISNTARYHSSGTYPAGAFVTWDPGYANVTIVADMNLTNEMGLGFRGTDGTNYFLAIYYAGTLYLGRFVAGAWTTVANVSVASPTFELRIECHGNGINIYVDGVLRISRNDSTFNTNTKHGLTCGYFSPETSSYVDNIVMSETVTPTAPGAPTGAIQESIGLVDITIDHPSTINRGTISSYAYDVYEEGVFVTTINLPVGSGNPLVGGFDSYSANSGFNYTFGLRAINSAGSSPPANYGPVLVP